MYEYSKKFPAKLLLFGEYTVTHGGRGLAIPFFDMFGHWQKSVEKGPNDKRDGLIKLHNFIARDPFLLEFLDNDHFFDLIKEGYLFESNRYQ